MSEEGKTVEIAEPIAKPEAKAPTSGELKDKGWSASEIESAEKRGMISKPEEKKPEAKAEEKPEAKIEEKQPTRNGVLPDFEIKDPAKEKVFLETFGPGTPQRAMYFRMKNERQSRQAAESRVRELEAMLEAAKAKPAVKAEVDGEGNPIDSENQPLTEKRLREIRQKEAEEFAKQDQELRQRAAVVKEAQTAQEEYVRTIHPDFDDTVKRAAEVMQNLDTLFPEKWKQAKAVKLIKDLQIMAANADKLGVDDENAAFIAYELGSMHPEHGKPLNGDTTDKDGKIKDPKANGGLTPEQMKRIEENTQRRASSASIPAGGGRRVISVEDVTLKDLNKMTPQQRQSFKEKNRTKYDELLRG